MEKIASFTVDHTTLLPGIYVSRKDPVGEEIITTFDIRFTRPNREPVLENPGIHTIEHLGATYLRNDPVWGKKVVYFGPMGCRTGFYLLLGGDFSSEDVVGLIRGMIDFIIAFQGEIPGATADECGNYADHDLFLAQAYARKFKEEVLENLGPERLYYR